MNTTQINALVFGKRYRVKIKTHKRRMVREYWGTEMRFGSILCAVFSTATPNRLRNCGAMPRGEYSVPHYDLVEAVPADEAQRMKDCSRCGGTGEEPGAPIEKDGAIALCDKCKGKG